LLTERKDQANLTDTERERFLCAFNVLNQVSTFGQLVDIHADMTHMMHSNPRFLPWHRIYLLKFEQALRSIHPDVTIPYWNWTQAGEQTFPPWLQSVTPTVVTPTRTINVTRSPGTPQDLQSITSSTPSVMQFTDFVDFWQGLEGIHNAVHVWVGGSMGSIPTAPAVPIFWMHHANVDRLWWQWQSSPQGQGKNPNLSGAAAVMDPWSYTEPDTRDITTLGYTYV
jgi:tyrosinase